MKRSNITFLLIVLMGMISNQAIAQDYDLEVDGNYYKISSASERAVGFVGTTQTGGNLIIPDHIIVSNKEMTVISVYASYLDVKSVIIPNSVKDLNLYGGNFEEVVLPPNLDHIRATAFKNCKSLKEIVLPNSISYIDHATFEGCSKLENVSMPPNLEYIEPLAFADCSSLHKIVIPSKVARIGGNGNYGTSIDSYFNAFWGFDFRLDTLVFEDSNEPLLFKGRLGPQSSDGHRYAVGEFGYQMRLNYLYIGREFKRFFISSNYASQLPRLGTKELVYGDLYTGNMIPLYDGIVSNSKYGVMDSRKMLEKVVFGKKQTAIGNFKDYINIKQIYVRSLTPPTAVAFSEKTYVYGTLFVPRGSLEAYSQANVWKEFWNIQEYDLETGITNVYEEVNNNDTVYHINGIHQRTLNKGLNIIKHNNGKVEKVFIR